MPKIIKPLTPTQVNNAKPAANLYRMFDGGGMHLEIPPRGRPRWRLKYRIAGRENRMSLGTMPPVGLAEARKARDKAKELIRDGIDPVAHRRQQKAEAARALTENTFEQIARRWHRLRARAWSATYAARVIRRLEIDVFPELGALPVADIRRADVVRVLDFMQDRGVAETAYRAARDMEAIFDYALVRDLVPGNVAARLTAAKSQVIRRRTVRHFAAITDPKEFGALLRAIDGYEGDPQGITRAGLQLLPLTMVRPGELRRATWSEIDLEAAAWTVPAERMKMKREHLVPLSRQARRILRNLRKRTGRKGMVLPGLRDPRRPLSNNTFNAALRRLGYAKTQMVSHGFRSSASTILNELGYNRDHIERQLAHVEKDNSRAPYNRAQYLPHRAAMLQEWADLLDQLRGES